MDDVYLLNSPFTFQSMEKHAAYCAMMRLGLKVPPTVLVPYKNPMDYAATRTPPPRYNKPFDLERSPGARLPAVHEAVRRRRLGGCVTHRRRGRVARGLRRERRAVHAPAAGGRPFDVFARSLSIGAETMVMRFQPERRCTCATRSTTASSPPRPGRGGDDLPAGQRVLQMGVQLLRALVADAGVPDRLRQRLPRRGAHRLHYYFPWAMGALVKWTVFALVTGRRPRLDPETDRLLRDRRRGEALPAEAGRYRVLADAYFDVDRYRSSATAASPAHPDQDRPRLGRQGLTWTSCWSTRCGPPTRRHSTISSSRTCAAWWPCRVADESARLRGA